MGDIRTTTESDRLILENRGLVNEMVKRFNYNSNDHEDIISIGTIGLVKAAISFNESKKIKFSTYACRCIYNEIANYFRKENKHLSNSFLSLNEPKFIDDKGNELTWMDTIPESDENFTDKIEKQETFIRSINIILNSLSRKERLVMLYKISGSKQVMIAETLGITQSRVSRIETQVRDKIKKYLNDPTIRTVEGSIIMEMKNDQYRISFYSNNMKQFYKEFTEVLSKISVTYSFGFNYEEKRIIIDIPNDLECFDFIAQIIQEIYKV